MKKTEDSARSLIAYIDKVGPTALIGLSQGVLTALGAVEAPEYAREVLRLSLLYKCLREALETWRVEAEFWETEAAMPLKLAFQEIVERIDSILSPEVQPPGGGEP